MNFESMILPALQGIGMNISCILTRWLLLEVTWRASDPMFSAEDYGLGHTGVDFCWHLLNESALGNWNSPGLEQYEPISSILKMFKRGELN